MKKSIYILCLLTLGLWGGMPAAAMADLLEIRVEENVETLRIALPAANRGKVFTLANPHRLVVDVPAVETLPDIRLPADYDGTLLLKARAGQFSPAVTRLVFDLSAPVRHSVAEEAAPALLITLRPAGKPAAAAGKHVRGDRARPDKPSKPQKPVVVIDAGHGGVDPGTIGPGGTREKDVVLEIAKILQSRLQKTGRYDVKLTRSDDRFIMLRKRIEIARRHNASIFISLHADSAPAKHARGLSVYTVSEQASDKEAEALAARENKADVIGGMDLSREREDVAGILISLAQRETMNRSATLADVLVDALEDEVTMLPNSHRFAGFAVLKAPDVPSVLIETGFLSNPKDEKLLKTKSYREKLTRGIVLGIDAYFDLVGTGQERP